MTGMPIFRSAEEVEEVKDNEEEQSMVEGLKKMIKG